MLIVLLGSVPVAQGQWFKLKSPDGDFIVEFPNRPTYEAVLVPATGEQLHTYHFNFGNHNFYFNYMELRSPIRSRSQVKTHIADYVQKHIRYMTDIGGQLLSRMSIPDGGVELVSKFPAGRMRETVYEQSRIYVRSTRRYVISCTSLSDSGVDQLFAQRFFNSLHLFDAINRQKGVDKNSAVPETGRTVPNAAEASWYKFTSPDGDFEAEFPAKPHLDTRAHPITGREVLDVSFAYGENDFSVTSTDLMPPLATPADREQWFVRSAEKFLRGTSSRLIRQTWLADGAMQIDSQGVLEGRTWFIRARFYLRGNRAYAVTCSTYSQSPSALDESVPSHFFNTFRLK
jgi:hypothetical protein